ncbi:hypothetical protein HK097_004396 [Rhizophlyctis rosea]|uniref:Cyclin-like domain-containing protein n=1 Tax=Rhizophlyctis rosea TaxID=64517 RepID=A0AAD5SH86_9FUNG|nr:hypothetical protein HK097_004396 [Rhizophlyctis rosea]
MKSHGVRDIALGAIFLASKVEECPKQIRDIINVCAGLIDHGRGLKIRPHDYAGDIFYEFKDGLIAGELQILTKLAFNVQVQHPHGFMINYLQALGLTSNEKLMQRAWNYMNDSCRTIVSVCYQPSVIACAVIFLAARFSEVKLPTNPPWWDLFEADLEDMEIICGHILNLYQRPVRRDLPLTVDELDVNLRLRSTKALPDEEQPQGPQRM